MTVQALSAEESLKMLVISMLQDNQETKFIAQVTGLTIDQINKIKYSI